MEIDESQIEDDGAIEFVQARFSIDLNLPPGDEQSLEDAQLSLIHI